MLSFESFKAAYLEAEEGAAESRAALEHVQQERIWSAACWRDYQFSVAERAFSAEIAQIESEFASEAMQMRDSMLGALMEQRQALIEERDRLVALQAQAGNNLAAPNTVDSNSLEIDQSQNTAGARAKRTLRSNAGTGKKEEAATKPTVPLPNATAPKRRALAAGTSILGVSTLLPEHEIYDDLNVISRLGGGDDLAAGRRNAPRTQAQKVSSTTGPIKKRSSGNNANEDTASVAATESPGKTAPPKRSLKDLSAPADESLSADEQGEEEETRSRASSSRKRSIQSIEEPAAGTSSKRKNSAEEKYITIEPSGAFYYCGCKYVKGSTFDISFGGREHSKTIPVTLLSAAGQEIQVKKNGDGSKLKISLNELLNGSVMILSNN